MLHTLSYYPSKVLIKDNPVNNLKHNETFTFDFGDTFTNVKPNVVLSDHVMMHL